MRAGLLFLLLAVVGPAQQVYSVAKGVVYLPDDGVALSSRTGRVRWRFASLGEGQTWSDGRRVLVVAYLAGINQTYHLRITRLCQLDPKNGKPYWCRDLLHYLGGALDARNQIFYLHQAGYITLYQLKSGLKLRSFRVPEGGELSLAALPRGGLLALIVENRSSQVWLYRSHLSRPLRLAYGARLLLLRQAGFGALLLNPRTGELLLAHWTWRGAALNALPPLPSPMTTGRYPLLALDRHGWILSEASPPGTLLAGAAWGKRPWRRVLPEPVPNLLASRQYALWFRPGARATRLHWLRLNNGHNRWQTTLPARYSLALTGKKYLALFGPHRGMALLRRNSGRTVWQNPRFSLVPLLLTRHQLIGWQGARLEAWSLRYNRPLWRVRFRLVSPSNLAPH